MRDAFTRLIRCASSSNSSLVTDPIKIIKIIINYILFNTDNYWGFPTSDIHRSYLVRLDA